MNNKPLLSICIPTYNRGDILKSVLCHYVECTEFDSEVEIVISDNASTDQTEIICRSFCEKYPNIRYFRNKQNIRDANFVKVLDYGRGDYLKLFNDWVYCTNETLAFMKRTIKDNINNKRPLFFSSTTIYTKYKNDIITTTNLDEFVKVVSTFVTYNNLFGSWNEQWNNVENKRKYAPLQLQQQDWIYQIVVANGGCLVYDRQIMYVSEIPLGKRGGYNWFQVHLDNYYRIMAPYIENGLITKETYDQDRHNLIEHFKSQFCNAFFYNLDENWQFDTKDTWRLLLKYYKDDPYFYLYLVKLPFFYSYMIFKRCKLFIASLIRK